MPFPQAHDVPFVTTEQMVEVDRAMIEDFGIELIQMMENAGRALAHLARVRFLKGHPQGKRVLVLAGTGGNGGGALVAARRLHNYGADVTAVLTKTDDAFTPVPRHQLNILRQMKVTVLEATQLEATEMGKFDLIIDGVIGYSLQGAPRGTAVTLITYANQNTAPTLALDAPSGVDTSNGTVFDPAIRADATLTLALPKAGLIQEGVKEQIGELYLADISVPPQLYASPSLNLEVGHIFTQSDIVRLN